MRARETAGRRIAAVIVGGLVSAICLGSGVVLAAGDVTAGLRLQATPGPGACAPVASLQIDTSDIERIAQGDAVWEVQRHANELTKRCPQTRLLNFELSLDGVRKIAGAIDGPSGRLRLGWQHPEVARLIAARYSEGRWRPAIEQRNEMAATQQKLDEQAAEHQRIADASPAPASAGMGTAIKGIRVTQLNDRVCATTSKLRVELESIDFVSTGDDLFALMEVVRELWDACPNITWVDYEVTLDGRTLRTGGGRRNTRLNTTVRMFEPASQAYQRGLREGLWRPSLMEEREQGLVIPAEIPSTPEAWAPVYRNTNTARALRAQKQQGREAVAAAMRPDGSGLAPFRRPYCHGLKQGGRSAQRPTERDVCEALYDHAMEHPRYALALPEAVQCTESFGQKASFPGGVLCDYIVERDVFVGLRGPAGFAFERRKGHNLSDPKSWAVIPRDPAVFAFDAQAKQWRVHPDYETVVAERNAPLPQTDQQKLERQEKDQQFWEESRRKQRVHACQWRNMGTMKYWLCD